MNTIIDDSQQRTFQRLGTWLMGTWQMGTWQMGIWPNTSMRQQLAIWRARSMWQAICVRACVAFLFVALLPTSQVSAKPKATEFSLANGLRAVVIEDHRAPIVTHMLWYNVGSVDDPVGYSGLAHYLEHMMFAGTHSYEKGVFDKFIAESGGYGNASTSYDYTNYYQRAPREALPDLMAFEADRMYNSRLDQDELDNSEKVVIEERNSRIENRPGALLSERVSATLYSHHRYGTPIIGWRHEIENLPKSVVEEFYKQYYRPDNALLVVAGDVDPDEVRAMAEASYGKIDRPQAKLIKAQRLQEPTTTTSRYVKLKDKRVRSTTLVRRYLASSFYRDDDDEAAALAILIEVLGASSRSRFDRHLVERDKVALSAGAYFDGGKTDFGEMVLIADLAPGKTIDDLEAAIDQEIAQIVADGITEDELRLAKNSLRAASVYQEDYNNRLASIYGRALLAGKDLAWIESRDERLQAVTLDEVTNVAQRYLDTPNWVTGLLLPQISAPKTPAPKTLVSKTPAPKIPAPKTPAPKIPAPKNLTPKTPEPKTPAPKIPASQISAP